MKRNDLGIYDRWANTWWSDDDRALRTLKNLVPPRMKYFTPIIGDWRGKRVLDLGCGGGFMSEALARAGALVTGVDPSSAAVEAARQHAERSGLKIDYQTGLGEKIPVDSGAMDAVVCVDVLEHVADLQTVCIEIARVLRSGGWFFFDTINRNALASFIMIQLGENLLRLLPRGTHDPAMFIKPAELRGALTRAQLDVKGMAGLGPVRINRRLDIVFGRLPGTAVMYLGHALK